MKMIILMISLLNNTKEASRNYQQVVDFKQVETNLNALMFWWPHDAIIKEWIHEQVRQGRDL